MINAALFIPWLPALAAVVCGLCCTRKSLRRYAASVCIVSIAGGFVLTALASTDVGSEGKVVKAFEWINTGGFSANFWFHIDSLTVVLLFVVTGIGTLVAIYASCYMKGDPGYARFFAGVSLFIFAMTVLVLADNLVLLYLGWEGVGLCSYLLIGFYYQKPAAVAAAKKAFIVNRIGDLGFALGIFLTYTTFGTVTLSGEHGVLAQAALVHDNHGATLSHQIIPFLLMLGAFGKSAQIPFYVWLPDAMEGPTPVSALIHAATMVTAGVYMIARMLPVFVLSEYALPTVAAIGGLTAFFAATIATCQYDLKRVWAYSTISQLGYMFLGVGVLSTVGGVFHLFTHAFFKALLFLTAGSVMHAMAGQLDLRRISGLRHKMPVTCVLMLIGCLSLAGVPFIAAGFYSKDMIIADAIINGMHEHSNLFIALAVLAIITAAMTAYYTFRLWFRVFMGPEVYEMGDKHPGEVNNHGHEHHHEPHEVPWLMNGPLVLLAIGSILAGLLCKDWIRGQVAHSSAAVGQGEAAEYHAYVMGMDVHSFMILVSFVVSLGGIAVAAYFHLFRREIADRLANHLSGLHTLLHNKWYGDEIYHAIILRPLHVLGQLCFVFDTLVIDTLVRVVGWMPGLAGRLVQPTQRGALQGYGLGMVVGAAAFVLIILTMI